MDILLISNEDICRSRIAQALLSSYGRGFKITTAGITEGSSVPNLVYDFMSNKGHEVSTKKPAPISNFVGQKWNLIMTLSKEAEEEVKLLNMQTDHLVSYKFEDPFADLSLDKEDLESQLSALYDDMYKELYEFYRDVLSELVMPRCTCGANTFCRCE